jgi:hypothetical protein
MAKKKTWLDKLNENKEPQIKRIEIDFADIRAGSNMLIASVGLLWIQAFFYGGTRKYRSLYALFRRIS